MPTNPPPANAAANLRARLTKLAGSPRLALVPDGAAIVAELADVLAQVVDFERRLVATERGFERLHRLVELGTADPGPC